MVKKYLPAQILLHWLVLGFVALQYLLHEPISESFEKRLEGAEGATSGLVALHIFGGTLILVLMMVRLLLRLSNELPAYPKENAPLQKLLSQIVHWSFYGLLFLLPLTGAVAWFRLSEAAGDLHEALRVGLLLVIALHVGAALSHEYLQRIPLLKRMWWG